MRTQENLFKIEKNIWKAFKQDKNGIGLYTGLSGTILFYDCLFDAYKEDEFEDKLSEVIEKTNQLIEENQNSILNSLCSGLAGYGLTLLRLKNKNIDISEEYFENIDDFLVDDFKALYESNSYDFLHEAMGVAMYFIERYKVNKNKIIVTILNSFAKDLISKINNNFHAIIIKTDQSRGKHFSLGIAHGIAAYLNFLIYLKTNCKELDVEISQCLKVCIDFLLANKKYDNRTKQYFANVVMMSDAEGLHSRLSWCQGDLGISNALFNAGVYLQDDLLIKEAVFLLNNCSKITLEHSGVVDFGFCHGSSGVLIQFFLASKKYNVDYSEAIDRWYLTLKEQTENFEKYPWYSNQDKQYFTEMDLLVGAVGLGLTLLTVDSKLETKWLEIFNLH